MGGHEFEWPQYFSSFSFSHSHFFFDCKNLNPPFTFYIFFFIPKSSWRTLPSKPAKCASTGCRKLKCEYFPYCLHTERTQSHHVLVSCVLFHPWRKETCRFGLDNTDTTEWSSNVPTSESKTIKLMCSVHCCCDVHNPHTDHYEKQKASNNVRKTGWCICRSDKRTQPKRESGSETIRCGTQILIGVAWQ